jgi:lipoprotein-releasing system permease protein
MLIIEKDDNIATFNALGASRKMITRIFMLEGWLISVVGGIVGIIIGVGLCLAQQFGKFIKLNGDPSQLVIDAYPVRVVATDLLIVLGLVIIVGLVTSQVTSYFTRQRLKK